jgi:hypothetical protein
VHAHHEEIEMTFLDGKVVIVTGSPLAATGDTLRPGQ